MWAASEALTLLAGGFTRVSNRLALAAVALVVVVGSIALLGPGVQANPQGFLTFRGNVGGGTITITTTPDRSTIVRFSLESVSLAPHAQGGCGQELSLVNHPRLPVEDGMFSQFVALPEGALGPAKEYYLYSGSFSNAIAIDGTISYRSIDRECESEELLWTAKLTQVPPHQDDLLFKGIVDGTDEQITVTTTADGFAITSATIGSLVHSYFDPALTANPTTGTFQANFSFGYYGGYSFLSLTIAHEQPDRIFGNLRWEDCDVIPYCVREYTWSAGLVPAWSTPTPAEFATARPTETPRPTALFTSTLTPTATPTRTWTPTRTPTPTTFLCHPYGDVNDNGSIDSVDAALILQFGAGLIEHLLNIVAADVNDDGKVDSIDAAIILQAESGLVSYCFFGCCP